MNTNTLTSTPATQLNSLQPATEIETITPATVSYISEFMQFLDASEATKKTYLKALKNFATYCNANSIQHPKRQDILAYKESLKACYKTNTVNLYLAAVKQLFNYLETEYNRPNPTKGVKKEKQQAGFKKDYLEPTAVTQVLKQFDRQTEQGARNYAMLLLMFTGGLRCIEITRVVNSDLQLLAGEYVLYVQGKGRTDKMEFIPIDYGTAEAIKAYKALQPPEMSEANAPIFTSTSNHNKGGALTVKTVSVTVKAAFKTAGLDSDRLTAHSTRHTAITLALKAGATVQQAQQFARHSNINTTLIYAHNLEQAENPCSSLIGKMLTA